MAHIENSMHRCTCIDMLRKAHLGQARQRQPAPPTPTTANGWHQPCRGMTNHSQARKTKMAAELSLPPTSPATSALSASTHWLTDAERDVVLASLHSDGFAVLPRALSPDDCAALARPCGTQRPFVRNVPLGLPEASRWVRGCWSSASARLARQADMRSQNTD